MGNWRTVSLRGSLAPEHVPAARDFITIKRDWSNAHCLSASEGLCGLGTWAAEEIHADGNLFERDYSVEDVAEELRQLAAIAPSLTLKAHCGDDWESTTCVATITVADGQVTVGEPERPTVTGVDEEVWMGRLFKAIGKP